MSQWCPKGMILCGICFACRRPEELATDTDGVTWDVCKGECAKASGIEEAVP